MLTARGASVPCDAMTRLLALVVLALSSAACAPLAVGGTWDLSGMVTVPGGAIGASTARFDASGTVAFQVTVAGVCGARQVSATAPWSINSAGRTVVGQLTCTDAVVECGGTMRDYCGYARVLGTVYLESNGQLVTEDRSIRWTRSR